MLPIIYQALTDFDIKHGVGVPSRRVEDSRIYDRVRKLQALATQVTAYDFLTKFREAVFEIGRTGAFRKKIYLTLILLNLRSVQIQRPSYLPRHIGWV